MFHWSAVTGEKVPRNSIIFSLSALVSLTSGSGTARSVNCSLVRTGLISSVGISDFDKI
jgi:hypothetical protein